MWMVFIPFISCLSLNSIAWSPRTFLAPCRQTRIFLANMCTWTWPFVSETKGQPLFLILSQKLHQLLKYSTLLTVFMRLDLIFWSVLVGTTARSHEPSIMKQDRVAVAFAAHSKLVQKRKTFRATATPGEPSDQCPNFWICHTRVAYQLVIRRTSSIIYAARLH